MVSLKLASFLLINTYSTTSTCLLEIASYECKVLAKTRIKRRTSDREELYDMPCGGWLPTHWAAHPHFHVAEGPILLLQFHKYPQFGRPSDVLHPPHLPRLLSSSPLLFCFPCGEGQAWHWWVHLGTSPCQGCSSCPPWQAFCLATHHFFKCQLFFKLRRTTHIYRARRKSRLLAREFHVKCPQIANKLHPTLWPPWRTGLIMSLLHPQYCHLTYTDSHVSRAVLSIGSAQNPQ